MKKRKALKKNLGAKLSQRFFGRRELAFGKKVTKHAKWRNLFLVVSAILVCGVLAAAAVVWGMGRVGLDNSAEAVVTDEFDPIHNYETVIEVGTIEQKLTLLRALESAPVKYANPPVQLDQLGRISHVAETILSEKSIDEQMRVRVTQSQIRALWHLFYVALVNNLETEDMNRRFFDVVSAHLDDDARPVAKAAHIAFVRGLAGRTITSKFQTGLGDFEDAISELLRRYPDDLETIRTVKVVFAQLRAADSEKAIDLARKISALPQQSTTQAGKQLARFLNDIVLLYENGIGDLSKVVDILEDTNEFYQRMIALSDLHDCGETVLTQIDNGIELLERRRENRLATKLSEKVLKSAERRPDETSRRMATRIGIDGVARNRLPGTKWKFKATDHLGLPIDSSRFAECVTLVVFLSSEPQQAASVLSAMDNLSKAMAGRNVQYVVVEIADKEGDPHNLKYSSNVNCSILLTNRQSPNDYVRQCPTERLPYLLLIDKNGIVDSINISFSVVMTRIEHLLSKN